jgi:CMP-N-acetylneuraminic acid synthetase
LSGKPLISYTIDAARQSVALSRCIISTDSDEIAAVCRNEGADVPFMRPAELAQDDTLTIPVILHALQKIDEQFDAVLILQPTSPLRIAEDIDHAIHMLEEDSRADSVISVVRVGDYHPARMKQIRDGVLIDPFFAEDIEGQRLQALPDLFIRNGAIYLTRTEVLRKQQSLKGKRSWAYLMPEDSSTNIAVQIDLLTAGVLLGKLE